LTPNKAVFAVLGLACNELGAAFSAEHNCQKLHADHHQQLQNTANRGENPSMPKPSPTEQIATSRKVFGEDRLSL
jgi:hypothetical protein